LSQLASFKLYATDGSTRLCSLACALICRATLRFEIKSAASGDAHASARPTSEAGPDSAVTGASPPARHGEVPHKYATGVQIPSNARTETL
jgi:hypothetical protein